MRGISETDFPSAIDYYCELIGISAYREALVKCRILLEQNLVAIETLGALSLTRYVFELLVWLRTLENDPKQAIEFYAQVAEEQESHLVEYEKKMLGEVEFFREVDKKDVIPDEVEALLAKKQATKP